MSIHPVQPLLFDFLDDRPVVVEVIDAPLSSDAGLLPLRQLDQRLGFTRQLAAALSSNTVLKACSDDLLAQAEANYDPTRHPRAPPPCQRT